VKTAPQVARLRAALAEVLAQRSVFSDDTYTQIVLAIYDRIRALQTRPDDNAALNSAVAENDEIRLVTVMFIDVVDSTEIMAVQRVDAEDWKKIIRDAHSVLRNVLRDWGGEVGQYLGDGLLCFFGAHHSQEDDALRAVYCALAIQEAIGGYARRVNDLYNINFAVRIGMSTGRVVVGVMGDETRKELLAVGTPTNLASRLQSLCAPGKVLIDSQTYQRVRNYFLTEAHPVTQVKGFDTPIEYYTVLGRRQKPAAQLTFNSIAGIATTFIGREREMSSLIRLSEQALNTPTFKIMTIYGDVVFGKSRLLQEALHRLNDFPFTQIVMVGSYEKRLTSFSLIHDLLAERCNLKEDTPPKIAEQLIVQHITETWPHPDAEPTAHIIGFLAGYGFGDSPHIRSLKSGGPDQKQIAFSWLAKWFHALAQSNGLLIAVDNLQWADLESLGLLEYLAQELRDEPGMLIGTARPEFLDYYPSYMSIVDWEVIMSLEPMSESDIQAMISAVLEHVDNVPPQLSTLIGERAEGNPLFVEEFLHMLFDNGVFELIEDNHWKVNRFLYATLTAQLLPNSLLALLQARLDEVPTTTRRVVQVASVMGQTFWTSAVAHIADLENIALELSDLETRGIIVQQADSGFDQEQEFVFRHTLYREVAYSMLTRPKRESFHRQVATWLAERVRDRPDYLGMLAEHYLHGQQHRESLSAYLMAAEDRFPRGLMRETLQMVESGLAAAREVPREIALPMVSRLWMLQGQALDALDRFEESSAASQTALMLMEEIPLDEMVEERVVAARTLGSAYLSLGRYDEAFDALHNAHTLLPKENVRQHAAVLRTFGALFGSRGQLNESLAYLQQAHELARESGDSREIARTMANLGMIALDQGDFAKGLDYTEHVLEMNRQDGNLYYQILDLSNLAMIHRFLFDYETALKICDQARALEIRIRYQDPLIKTNQALCMMMIGQREQGLKLLREAADTDYQNMYTYQRVQLAFITGMAIIEDYDRWQDAARALIANTRNQNRLLYGRGMLWLGMAQNALGDIQSAQATLREALKNELAYGGRDVWLGYHALANASSDAEEKKYYARKSLNALQAIATSLEDRPNLQAAVLNNPFAQWLTEHAH
jgi:class 3 adenylate cyclase/tetratricopeptide (TPR) repeat protein